MGKEKRVVSEIMIVLMKLSPDNKSNVSIDTLSFK